MLSAQPEKFPVIISPVRRPGRHMDALVRTAGATLMVAVAGSWIPARAYAQPHATSRSVARGTLVHRATLHEGKQLVLGALYQQLASASPRIAAAQALERAIEARVPGARRPPDPKLTLGFMGRELPSLKPMAPLGMTQLELMQVIPVAGQLGLAGRVAEARAAAARNRTMDVRWELRAQVALAFYDLYRTDRSLDVAKSTRRLLQNIATTAQAMYAVGEGQQPDVLRAQVEIARRTSPAWRQCESQSTRDSPGS